MWKLINSVLHPPPQRIRAKPDELNSYFSSTAKRILNATKTPDSEVIKFINQRPKDDNKFRLREVMVHDIKTILKSLKSGTSTGADKIPVKCLKACD